MTAFDVVKHRHETLTAEHFNGDDTFSSCLNEVFHPFPNKPFDHMRMYRHIYFLFIGRIHV